MISIYAAFFGFRFLIFDFPTMSKQITPRSDVSDYYANLVGCPIEFAHLFAQKYANDLIGTFETSPMPDPNFDCFMKFGPSSVPYKLTKERYDAKYLVVSVAGVAGVASASNYQQ